MSTSQSQHNTSSANLYMDASGDSPWIGHEQRRLRTMGELLAELTRQDLGYAFDILTPSAEDAPALRVLDFGAGSADDVHNTVRELGGEYFAFDVNAPLLDRNPAPDGHKLFNAEGRIPAEDGSFDVVYARAVLGWHRTPERLITMVSEMMRVLRPGGMLVVSDFAWNDAGPVIGNDDFEVDLALTEAKQGMLMALGSPELGFDPDFGDRLGNALDGLLQDDRRYTGMHATRHSSLPGDHRDILLDTAENIKLMLERKGGVASEPAAMLRESIPVIRAAEHCVFTLPTLATHFVHTQPNSL